MITNYDRWLTTPPDDPDSYIEAILDIIPDDIWQANEEWLNSDECINYINNFSIEEITPEEVAIKICKHLKKFKTK